MDEDRDLDGSFVLRWVREAARTMHEQRDYLTQLDAAIGDADHGINMDRGLTAAAAEIESADGAGVPGRMLENVGRVLVLSVGGAAGPLYGSAFREMGKALGELPGFDAEDLLTAMRAGLDEVRRLGAASEGDKTIVDAFVPALAGFERALRKGGDLAAASTAAHEAAEQGMKATTPMQARKGRASCLGIRSVGHQDPGATSTALLFGALERATEQLGSEASS
jgi:phosphoenolpyruvate---glycerone phosphotransferase subunit DhaL